MSCAYPGCRNRRRWKVPNITYHSFPSNPERLLQWVDALQRQKTWRPGRWDLVCSAHFTEECIDRTSKAVVRLREFAVPTISLSYEISHQQEPLDDYEDSADINPQTKIVETTEGIALLLCTAELSETAENWTCSTVVKNDHSEPSIELDSAAIKNQRDSMLQSDLSQRATSRVAFGGKMIVSSEQKKCWNEELNQTIKKDTCNNIDNVYPESWPDNKSDEVETPEDSNLKSKLNQVPAVIDIKIQKPSAAKEPNETAENGICNIVMENSFSVPLPLDSELNSAREIELQHKLDRTRELFYSTRRRLKTTRAKHLRTLRKNAKLAAALKDLKKKNDLYESELEILRSTTGVNQLFGSQHAKGANTKKYNTDLRDFALTLHRYSPKAYKYVRSKFGKVLPHSRTLHKWKASIEGQSDSTIVPVYSSSTEFSILPV